MKIDYPTARSDLGKSDERHSLSRRSSWRHTWLSHTLCQKLTDESQTLIFPPRPHLAEQLPRFRNSENVEVRFHGWVVPTYRLLLPADSIPLAVAVQNRLPTEPAQALGRQALPPFQELAVFYHESAVYEFALLAHTTLKLP